MNYIKHLSAVFEKMDADTRITPYHISLYMTLFRRWNLNFFRNPISVSRDELMRLSKIGSVNTYTKCLKQLDQFGYIQYIPSYNPHKGSLINLYTFSKGSDNGNEIAMRPFINNGIVGYFFYILFINFLFCSPLNFLELLQLIAAHCSNVSIPFFHSTHAIQSRGSGGVLVYC